MELKSLLKARTYNFLVCYLLVWIVFQDFFISIFYNITGFKIISQLLLYSKDLVMVILFLISIYKIVFNKENLKKYKIILSLIGVYLAIIAIYGVWSLMVHSLPLIPMYATMRGIILLPVFIVIALGVEDREQLMNFIINKFFILLIIVAIIGIIDYFIGTKDFWRNIIGIGDYTADIKNQLDRLVEGLPGNFYGDYGTGYFSQKRLVSVWAVPLTAAYVLCIPYIYYLFSIKELSKKYIKEISYSAILFISILFTYTRAIIIPCIAVLIIYILYRNRRLGYKLFVPIFIGLFVFGLIFRNEIVTKIFDGSTAGHIESIVSSIVHINFWGSGIGTFGVWSDISTENSYITILGQIGLVGLINYIAIWLIPIKKLIQKYIVNNKLISKIDITVLTLTVIYFITGIASEQIFAFTTIVPYYLLLGITFNKAVLED